MSFAGLLNQPLTIQRRAADGQDGYGNAAVQDVGDPVTVSGYLEQRSSTEYVNGRDTTITGSFALLPAGTEVGPLDTISYAGVTYQVDGQPMPAWNPRLKAVHHIEVALKAVS